MFPYDNDNNFNNYLNTQNELNRQQMQQQFDAMNTQMKLNEMQQRQRMLEQQIRSQQRPVVFPFIVTRIAVTPWRMLSVSGKISRTILNLFFLGLFLVPCYLLAVMYIGNTYPESVPAIVQEHPAIMELWKKADIQYETFMSKFAPNIENPDANPEGMSEATANRDVES